MDSVQDDIGLCIICGYPQTANTEPVFARELIGYSTRNQNILKSVTALKNLAEQDALEWPTVKLLLGRIQVIDGEMSYQGATVKNYTLECQEKTKKRCYGGSGTTQR